MILKNWHRNKYFKNQKYCTGKSHFLSFSNIIGKYNIDYFTDEHYNQSGNNNEVSSHSKEF